MPNQSAFALGGKSPRLVLLLLTGLVLLVHGYHPYAEDGGVYVAEIKQVLDPGMYGATAAFVTGHLHFSLFNSGVAGMVRVTSLPLAWVLLGLYGASVWLTLRAGWQLAESMTASRRGRVGAVALLACWFALPVAGTSLLLMDPYVTARSFSTPLTLFALAAALQAVAHGAAMHDAAMQAGRAWVRCVAALSFAALLHPLMAGYGSFAVLLLATLGSRTRPVRRWGPLLLGGAALAMAAGLQAHAAPESAAYVRVAMTRYYWFPTQWAWYERLGIPGPLLVIAMLGLRGQRNERALPAKTAIAAAGIALAVALAFARPGLAVHAVARMQPLRCMQIVYVVMILLLGAWLGERWLWDRPWRWCALLAVAGGAMFAAERGTYAASAHLEMPWLAPVNPWEQGFVWIRDHTPKHALLALDARYITRGKGEDAQGFRAIAERDALPDYSKDGGEAAIAPQLTDAWIRGQTAQSGLEYESDAAREAALRPFGVSWVILETDSSTRWDCPYANRTIKVCRLPE